MVGNHSETKQGKTRIVINQKRLKNNLKDKWLYIPRKNVVNQARGAKIFKKKYIVKSRFRQTQLKGESNQLTSVVH